MPRDVRLADPANPLIPPRIIPPREPLSLWRLIPNLLSNPLRTIPEAVYQEPSFCPPKLEGRAVWITDPALVERVLLKDHEKFRKTEVEHRVFDPIIGGGILTADGQDWRWQRRLLAPLFRPLELLTFVPAIAAAADRQLAIWQNANDLDRRRVDHDMTNVTFDVLCATLFAGSNADENTVLKTEIDRYLERSSWEIAYALLELPANFWHPYKRAMRRSADALRKTILNLIARERKSGWHSGGLGARLGMATDPESGQTMSDNLIASNLATFAAAGHETTAKALTWTLYLLARSPEWQARVRAEVVAVAGNGPVRAEHVERLVLSRQVLNESMRLFPPVPVMTRATREPMQLGKHALVAPALVVMPIYVIHRHRKLWQRPDEFDPDRFTPECEKAYLRTQFMPFGFGPRTCIGMSFAMIEATVLLATLVRGARFTWDGVHAPEPVSRVTLRPRGGMPLAVNLIT